MAFSPEQLKLIKANDKVITLYEHVIYLQNLLLQNRIPYRSINDLTEEIKTGPAKVVPFGAAVNK
jgi:hypothetical protein